MNTANYAQEKMFRMHAARTRMGQNLRRLGFVDDVDATGKIQRTAFQKAEELLHKTPDQLNDLQKAQLENIKIAMYDSYDHALKMTLA
jgi:1,4-dihydroxy-2-naphthoyl-CoA synthase